MIQRLSKNQNWAKAAPILGVAASIALIFLLRPSQSLFWALINIPLYLFHQTEEHLWPGGFKNYVNHVINGLPQDQETLTDTKVFWINILLVWVAFTLFGILSFINIGFGLLIVVFSIINCLTHIYQGIRRKAWNPGLVMASLQFLVSLYAAYFITTHGLSSPILWWIGTVVFSALAHALVFKVVLSK